jgi:NAD(P)-dependent dehydrogenase (short-subunit alcohol dehydrogenase family)
VGGLRGSGAIPLYCTSKGAVRLLTLSLGQLLGPERIRVNALMPGLTDTAMNRADLHLIGPDGEIRTGDIPLGRFAQPAEIADGAVYLASDLASFVNSACLVIDGGRLAS